MQAAQALQRFFPAIAKDSRIGIKHIGLYLTLIYLWEKQGFAGSIQAFSRDVMPLAKISSSTTYNKLIHELDGYGYISYQPSYYKGKASQIFLIHSLTKK
jgi:replication initiation and membrane attachment protein DnaB